MLAKAHIRSIGNSLMNYSLNFRHVIFHSRVTRFVKDERDSGLSIKLVLDGCEQYKVDGVNHSVRSGHYFLINEHQGFQCNVDSPTEVEGLCIYLDPDLVYQIHRSMTTADADLLASDPGEKAPQMHVFEKQYALSENELGAFLNSMIPLLRDHSRHGEVDFDGFFMLLSEHLVRSQSDVRTAINRLPNERNSTREEIYRRVSIARNFIDAHFAETLDLDQLASEAFMSKYHFLRCFKQVYGCSPYQYVIYRRLETAREKLSKSRMTLTEIAYQTGFSDRRAFSKAFRKHFGLSPTEYIATQ